MSEEKLAFESKHVLLAPSIGIRRYLLKSFFAAITAGLVLDAADALRYKENHDLHLLNGKHGAVRLYWSGLRLGLSAGVKLLVHALGVTSDIEYEPAVGGFLPVAHEVDGISAISHSDYLSVTQEQPATITFETNLPSQHINDNATVVEVVGIEFFQGFDNRYLPMAQGKAAMVVGAF